MAMHSAESLLNHLPATRVLRAPCARLGSSAAEDARGKAASDVMLPKSPSQRWRPNWEFRSLQSCRDKVMMRCQVP